MSRTTAVATTQAATLSPAELTALLQGEGMAEQGSSAPRLKFANGMLIAPDTGEMFVYNPSKPDVPMATVRLLGLPDEYFVYWVNDEIAAATGLQDLIGKPSKKFLKPDPGRQTWDSDDAYDQIRAAGFKSKWSADLLLQFLPDDGALKGDETVYTLTLPTTSLIEFKGTSKNPEIGSVSDTNFVRKVAMFASSQCIENNPKATRADVENAIKDAMTSLRNGGVAAEVRVERAENKEMKTSWMVLVFDPVHIEPVDAPLPELTDGSELQSEDVPL